MYKVIVKVDDITNYAVAYADTLVKALDLLNEILLASEINLEMKGVNDITIIKVWLNDFLWSWN